MSAITVPAGLPATRRRVLRGLPWVAWRQHRLALVGAFVAFGGIGAYLVVSGLSMHHAFRHYGLASCGDLSSFTCEASFSLFRQQYQDLAVYTLPQLLFLLPGLLGVFVGAPIVARELESGTYRFAWTQGRSRVRWIVAKLAILATVLTVLTLGFSVLFSWWYGPWTQFDGRMSPAGAYEVSGLVFAARTLFAFMLGALAGTLIRRTVPAMVATAAVWLAVVLTSMNVLRPLIEKPVTQLASLVGNTSLAIEQSGSTITLGTNPPLGSWEVDRWTQNAAGHHLSSAEIFNVLQQANVNLGPPPGGPATTAVPARGAAGGADALTSWLADHGYRLGVSYQPASRFWHFQGVEAAAYVLLALACGAVTVWWVKRRAA